jgi:hypothetical protein
MACQAMCPSLKVRMCCADIGMSLWMGSSQHHFFFVLCLSFLRRPFSVSDVMSDRVAAFVARAEVADADDSALQNELPRLADVFSIGQLLRTVVVRLDDDGKNKRIELTLRPSIVNRGWSPDAVQVGMVVYGAVKSVEGTAVFDFEDKQ